MILIVISWKFWKYIDERPIVDWREKGIVNEVGN